MECEAAEPEPEPPDADIDSRGTACCCDADDVSLDEKFCCCGTTGAACCDRASGPGTPRASDVVAAGVRPLGDGSGRVRPADVDISGVWEDSGFET